ncbi:MAG: hypothetical protein GY906_25765 [bacterium]|nr:hypothetical protein [bacterium]
MAVAVSQTHGLVIDQRNIIFPWPHAEPPVPFTPPLAHASAVEVVLIGEGVHLGLLKDIVSYACPSSLFVRQ